MRLYLYINKEILRCIAAKSNVSDFSIIEYREKETCIKNTSKSIRPEIEDMSKKESVGSSLSRLCVVNDDSRHISFEKEKRYIAINDITEINNLCFYYNLIENINTDDRLKIKNGVIEKAEENAFYIGQDKYIISDKKDLINEILENKCLVNIVCYKINRIEDINGVYKVIAIFIE